MIRCVKVHDITNSKKKLYALYSQVFQKCKILGQGNPLQEVDTSNEYCEIISHWSG